MTEMHDFDRLLVRWLDESDPGSPPAGLAERAIAEAASLPHTRIWLPALQRDFPMQTSLRLGRAPSLAWVLVAVALIAAIAVGVAASGALRHRVPPPFGLASNGLIAFDTAGRLVEQRGDSAGRIQIPTPPGAAASPMFSPDGSRLAYWLTNGSVLSIVLAHADGSNPTTVAMPGGWFTRPDVISWAPTSDRIAITPSTGLATIRVGDAAPTDLHTAGPNLSPTWSTDGTRIAYVHRGNTIRVVTADGTDDREVAAAPDGGAIGDLSWQPGGSLLGFYAGQSGHDIYTVPATGGRPDAVAPDPTDQFNPAWSPDGKRLAFLRTTKFGSPQGYQVVVIVDVGQPGAAPVVLDPIRHASVPADAVLDSGGITWSPDGKAISGFVFRPVPDGTNGDNQVLVFDAETGNQIVLLDSQGNVGPMSWQRTSP